MYGQDILCGISKVTFEIPHKISYPYIERYDFYTTLKFVVLLDLRAQTRFWNAPLATCMNTQSDAAIPIQPQGLGGKNSHLTRMASFTDD